MIILLVLLSSIKVVNTGYLYVVERLGQFHKILEPGWHFVIPGVDFVRKKVSTKQQILDVPPQSVITKDNVKISVDNVIFYKMLNAKDAVYNIEDYKQSNKYHLPLSLSSSPYPLLQSLFYLYRFVPSLVHD